MADMTSKSGKQPAPSSRHTRRKAETRARIIRAADRLFEERGYAEASIEDISEAADVAVRTIYTHFPSKAAILLAYFDGWLTALVDGILTRPPDEPIADALAAALRAMTEAGWVDRSYAQQTGAPPYVTSLIEGPPEVAGHMMHAWMRAQDRIASDAAERGDYPEGSLEPQARATAVFAACMGPIMVALTTPGGRRLPPETTSNSLVIEFVSRLTRGNL